MSNSRNSRNSSHNDDDDDEDVSLDDNQNDDENSRTETILRASTAVNNNRDNNTSEVSPNTENDLATETVLEAGQFDLNDYNQVMAVFSATSEMTAEIMEAEELRLASIPKISVSTLGSFRSAIKKLHSMQFAEHSNRVPVSELDSQNIKDLFALVKKRNVNEAREQCRERMNRETSPYVVAERLCDIEIDMFDRSAKLPRIDLAGLRNRFVWLFTLAGLLRGESLFKGDLADLFVFEQPTRSEPHPYEVLVLKMETGKTNKDKTLLGRVLRNRNVKECPFGALGFYLLARFAMTNELNRYDFTKNKSWFNAKILIGEKGLSNGMDLGRLTKAIDNRPYGDEIGRCCDRLNLPTSHFVHLGRNQGPIRLEMAEVPPEYIKILGNWNPDTQESVYSSKFPVPALRVAAGFDLEKGGHYNPRTKIQPPKELQQLIFPELEQVTSVVNAAIEERLARIQRKKKGRARNCTTPLATATSFLRLLKKLRRIILQDAAAMMAEGRDHPLFGMPVFKSTLFLQFTATMKDHLESTSDHEPIDLLLQRVMPTVNARMTALQQGIAGLTQKVAQLENELNARLDRIEGLLVQLLERDSGTARGVTNELQAMVETTRTATTMAITQQQQLQEQLQQQLQEHTATTTTTTTTSPTIGLSVAAVQAEQATTALLFEPSSSYKSVSQMWTEWHHFGIFDKEPLHDRAKRSKTWRAYMTDTIRRRFTRMKSCVELVDKLINGRGWEEWKALLYANLLFERIGRKMADTDKHIRAMFRDDPELVDVVFEEAEALRAQMEANNNNNEENNENDRNDENGNEMGEAGIEQPVNANNMDGLAVQMVVGDESDEGGHEMTEI